MLRTSKFLMGSGKEITRDLLTLKLSKSQNASKRLLLLDVRTPQEYTEGNIPSSVNVPVDELPDMLDNCRKSGALKGVEKDSEIIVYCKSGKRSSLAQLMLEASGYTNVLNYKGSWLDWSSSASSQVTR